MPSRVAVVSRTRRSATKLTRGLPLELSSDPSNCYREVKGSSALGGYTRKEAPPSAYVGGSKRVVWLNMVESLFPVRGDVPGSISLICEG